MNDISYLWQSENKEVGNLLEAVLKNLDEKAIEKIADWLGLELIEKWGNRMWITPDGRIIKEEKVLV